MTEGTEQQRFELRDGQRPVYLDGWMIADADSQTGSDPRWTELTLYRTITGKYVLEKVGRSDVFHSAKCTRKSKGVKHERLSDVMTAEESYDDFFPCPQCRPSYDDAPVFVERDISAVAVYATASQLVGALFRHDSDNMRYLSRVARSLLEQAAAHDADISNVINSPADIT